MPDSPSHGRTSPILLVASGIGLAIALVLAILLLGRLATTDVIAIALTSALFAVALVAILLLTRGRREWLLALGLPFVIVAAVAGIALGRPLVTDKVVDEQVVSAEEPSTPPTSAAEQTKKAPSAEPAPTTAASPRNVRIASGRFEDIAHPGQGTATLIRTSAGEVKLTFTNFSTDNGPDVRVYLSRGTKDSGVGTSHVDIGALKGNKGNQQYSVPNDVDLSKVDSIVLWCRAFDVGFIQAPLTQG